MSSTKWMSSLAVCALSLACDGGKQAANQVASIARGVTLSAAAAPNPGRLRVLVYHDMEGLAGQDDFRTFNFSHQAYYARGRQLLADDVNAVVRGLFAGGASSVDILDAHGSGNPEPDLMPSLLDPRAKQVQRDSAFRHYVDVVAPNVYDAVAAVAMHAKTGSGGFASHTITIGMAPWMNGHPLTETEIVAYSWGRVGVPVIFVSGDDRLERDLETMPWIQYVVTKRATSASSVDLRNVDSVHAEMEAKAAKALRGIANAKVMRVREPVEAGLRVVHPASLTMLHGVPGVALSDSGRAVAFTAKTFQEAYDGINALIGVARLAYPSVQMEVVRSRGDSAEVLRLMREKLMTRWLDVESGRWVSAIPSSRPIGRKYHGAQ